MPTTSTTAKTPAKKLPKGFSLYPRANGQYAKKINGKLHYFGKLSEPEAAWKKYLDERDDIQAGRPTKRQNEERITLKELCEAFYSAKVSKFNSRELSQTMLSGYKRACDSILAFFGKHQIVEALKPLDFQRLRDHFAKGVGLVTLSNRVQHARVLFKYASDQDLIEHPLKFGQDFKKPKKMYLRAERNAKPAKMFEADEIRNMLAEAKQPLKAMILLGINCGFGQTDCSRLPLTYIDMEDGWINYPRPKTEVNRRCPLWPETVKALREAIAKRRKHQSEEHAHLTFITRAGANFVRATEKGTNIDGVAQEFGKVLRTLELSGSRRGFYALRHTFETIGGASRDQVAVDSIMGHAPNSNDMSAVYRERVDDDRLRAVVDHIRAWLWPKLVKKVTKKSFRKKAK